MREEAMTHLARMLEDHQMSSRLRPLLAIVAIVSLAACGGSTATGTAGVSSPVPAVSAPAASEPAASAPAASTGGGSAAPCAPSTAAGTVQASMAGTAFTPSTIQAKVGDVIAWTNNDAVGHTATVDDDPTCTTETLAQGASGALTFSAAGTYAFHCKIHSSMTGTIEITE
jgi:plastocyanin